LAQKLRKFYCEATPKTNEKRQRLLPEPHRNMYHRKTLTNVRCAINRHLRDLGRNMDIVRNSEFTKSNRSFEGFLRSRAEAGLTRPMQQTEILTKEDIEKIAVYLQNYESSPIVLREAAWYMIAVHFVPRGVDFYHQLRIDSFEFMQDTDSEFVFLNQETTQNFNPGRGNSKHSLQEKRIYATGSPLCPVKILKFFRTKLNSKATMLFSRLDINVLPNPEQFTTWYSEKPLSKRSLVNFMKNICEGAHLSHHYSGPNLRATAALGIKLGT